MYPVMSVAYMIIYLLQSLMIFQFYLDDAPGALLASMLFLLGTAAGSLLSDLRRFLPAPVCCLARSQGLQQPFSASGTS